MHKTSTGLIVWEQFKRHLNSKHSEWLCESDRNLVVPVQSKAMTQYLVPRTSTQSLAGGSTSSTEVPSSPSPSLEETPRSFFRGQSSFHRKLTDKIVTAIIKVIAHGPFPISLLMNPAVRELLIELDVVEPDFDFPSTTTITRKLDLFLDEENKSQLEELKLTLDYYSIQWDEWSSKQNLNYMALNCCEIPPCFSKMIDFLVACSLFPYPHLMPDLRNKVLSLADRVLPLGTEFKVAVKSACADGAAVNRCFSPDPEASGITQREKQDRKAICEEYSKLEEQICICHRLVSTLEHVIDDKDSETSNLLQSLIFAVYSFYDLINVSQKNLQALQEMQENDPNRKGRVVFDISTPKTRWNYNARRLLRVRRLWPYASIVIPQTTDTKEKEREWAFKKKKCSEALGVVNLVSPLLERYSEWIVYFQNTVSPTISLMLYMIDDIDRIADNLANKSDQLGHEEAECILSRFLAEQNAEFVDDKDNDYLKLAQLFDPRVSYRSATSKEEVDRLLELAKKYVPEEFDVIEVDGDESDSNVWGETAAPIASGLVWNEEKQAFKRAMQKVQQAKTNIEGEKVIEFYGGVSSCADVDVFQFYRDNHSSFPKLATAIRIVLGNAAAATSCERAFGYSSMVISAKRAGLLPTRAEKLILSASRHRNKLRFSKSQPKLPLLGIFEKDIVAIDDEFGTLESDNQVNSIGLDATDVWEAFTDAFHD